MHARDIMTHEVITIQASATVRDAARRLSDYHISGMPVVDDAGKMVGIITEADLISKEGADVAALMTGRVVSVTEQTSVDEIAQILTSNRYKRVPVLRDGRLVGIVSRADIVRMMASRWICPVCGAIQMGRVPSECQSCGVEASRFERELNIRPEITSRQ
jgi:CBS-domain-containing membrane protein